MCVQHTNMAIVPRINAQNVYFEGRANNSNTIQVFFEPKFNINA